MVKRVKNIFLIHKPQITNKFSSIIIAFVFETLCAILGDLIHLVMAPIFTLF